MQVDPTLFPVVGLAALLALAGLILAAGRRLSVPPMLLLAGAGYALGEAVRMSGDAGTPLGAMLAPFAGFGLTGNGYLNLFLPPLLFAAGLTVELRRLRDDLAPVLLLAVVAVIVCTAAVGLSVAAFTGIGLAICLVLGAVVATTDTAAVVSIFRSVGAPRRLATLVEGESLFNDAAAIALFGLFLAAIETGAFDPGAGAVGLVLALVGGGAFGWLAAILTVRLVTWLRDSAITETTLTVALAYAVFVVANTWLGVSGVFATVVAAMTLGAYGRTQFSPGGWESLSAVWRQLDFWATSLLFVLGAMAMPEAVAFMSLRDVAAVAVLFVAALVARAAVLWGLLPVFSAAGWAQPVSGAFKAVLWWGGMRGAVTVALALAASETPAIPEDGRRLILVLSIGYVLATLVVNGLTLRPLMRALGLEALSASDKVVRARIESLAAARVLPERAVIAQALGLPVEDAPPPAWSFMLPRAERLALGLAGWGAREAKEARLLAARGVIGGDLARRIAIDAEALADVARTAGRAGYEAVMRRQSAIPASLRLALWLQRNLGVSGLLAALLARRYERLLAQGLVLGKVLEAAAAEAADLMGSDAAEDLHALIVTRAGEVAGALEALDLQYTEYGRQLRALFLARITAGLEQAEYARQLADAAITPEVFDSLSADVRTRLARLERTPPLDLGLRLAELMRASPVLAALEPQALRRLARDLVPIVAVPGERIVRAGDAADAMYVIASGAVDVVLPGGATVRLGSGSLFGEMALVTGGRRNADVVAVGYAQLLRLSRRAFQRVIAQNAPLRAEIERLVAARTAGHHESSQA